MDLLNFSKTVLDKVSFDEKLFEKELQKSINRLTGDEVEELRTWAFNHFPQLTPIIHRCFFNSVPSNYAHLATLSLMSVQ